MPLTYYKLVAKRLKLFHVKLKLKNFKLVHASKFL